jgi:hypothetical protein
MSLSPNQPVLSLELYVSTVRYIRLTKLTIPKVMTALNGACQQQPAAGQTVSLQGSLFSMTPTNITSPTPTPGSSFAPSSSKISLGAKVGIAVACAILLLGILGSCIIWRGKRRRRIQLEKHQQETGYAAFMAEQQGRSSVLSSQPRDMSEAGGSAVSGRGAFYDSPQSQRPLVSNVPWRAGRRDDETPVSAVDEKAYFSPYSSQYGSPVSATDPIQVFGQQWPMDRKVSPGGSSAFGSFQGRSRSTEKREPKGDNFELQNVAPVCVLKHPGNGRQGSLGSQGSQRSQRSQYSVSLTEEDHRRGSAL